jgi:hypothetical protein
MLIGPPPTQLCGVFQVKESATLSSIGPPIRPGALTPLPQTKLYTLTARIHRRADKATWRQITFDLRSTPSFSHLIHHRICSHSLDLGAVINFNISRGRWANELKCADGTYSPLDLCVRRRSE